MTIADYHVVTFTNGPGAYLVGPGGVVHLDADMRDAYVVAGARQVRSSNADVYASYRRVAQGITS